MIICICNNVNHTTIQNAISDGADSLDAVRELTTATACCGKCKFKVNGMLNDQQEEVVEAQAAC